MPTLKQAHLQTAQSRHIRLSLQKSLLANAPRLTQQGRTANKGFAKIRADGSYLRLFVILLCFISGWTLSI